MKIKDKFQEQMKYVDAKDVATSTSDKVKAVGKHLKQQMSTEGWEDGEFMDDVRQATLRGAHPLANILFWTSVAFVVVMLTWASFAEIDEVTSGEGKVIPSSQVQVVQNREGGIVESILVKEGDVVEAGEVLIRLDDTEFSSSYAEKLTQLLTSKAEVARLAYEAEMGVLVENVSETEIQFPVELEMDAPHIIDQQKGVYVARKAQFENALNVLKQQLAQREQELKELEIKKGQTARTYELSLKELDLTKPLLKDGVVSEVEVLRLERQVNDLLGEKEAAELALPRAEASIEEARQRVQEAAAKFKSEILVELSEKKEEVARLTEILRTDKDKVTRTTVRSPVKASVKRVLVNTVGGVIQPGMDLVELIPIEDSLLVEAKIRPKDIAFLRPNQKAQVKITAYDYSIYGGLEAELVRIGVDTVADERGEAFYHIRVRTDQNHLGTGEQQLPIIPGMVATVDILTGKKTVLDYILKPFNKMKNNALRER